MITDKPYDMKEQNSSVCSLNDWVEFYKWSDAFSPLSRTIDLYRSAVV